MNAFKINWITKGELEKVTIEGDTATFHYPCESHEVCYPYFVDIPPAIYQFECYGGVGGDSMCAKGGSAGVTKGVIVIRKKQNFVLYVGATGLKNDIHPIFGGGGKGSKRTLWQDGEGGGSGGGASDIRIYEHDFNSRIMVAGGGAGAECHENVPLKGGNAGGLNGAEGEHHRNVIHGMGGTQSSGGSGGMNGIFGFGANTSTGIINEYAYYGSGGGGGYFGGGSGSVQTASVSSGGGGSSFIAGYAGCTINTSFSSFTFFKTEMLTGYTGEPKIIIQILSQLNHCSCQNSLDKNIYIIYCFILITNK